VSTFLRTFVILFLVAGFGCGGGSKPLTETASSSPEASAPAPPARSSPAPATDVPRIVFLGDSLTAGLGLEPDQSFPSLLQRRLTERGYKYQVINAGVSGDTSAGGLRRLDWSLDGNVKVLVVALGANDGLRGLSPMEMQKNLTEIIERASARGITVVLAGMEAPPNNGVDYTAQFRSVYAELARTHKVRFIPFLLQGVAGIGSLNQGDGIHPNVRGAQMVADLVWASIEPVLSKPVAR
jgi:acyl-CoA thioesterase I